MCPLWSALECFENLRNQVGDYLFKWTGFIRIKYIISWVVGQPNHPQLQNYMTCSIVILFTLFQESG